MFSTTLVILILVAIFWAHSTKKRIRNALKNINGPFAMPFFGIVTIPFTVNPKNIFQRDAEIREQYGKVIKFMFLNRYIISSADAELNEQVLSSQQPINKSMNYKMLQPWLGLGLLLSDGKKWHSRRKILTPAFHFKILERFIEVFDQQSTIFIERLATKADGRTVFDVRPFVCLAALDIIAETSMGVKVKAQLEMSNRYAAAVNELTKIMAYRFMKMYLNNDIIYNILRPFQAKRQRDLIKIMHDFTNSVIEERRDLLYQELKQKQQTTDVQKVHDDDDAAVGVKNRMALLDILLQSSINGQPLTNEDIREEVDTFMFEGHDTTTSALCFGFYLIARHAHVQRKLYEEIVNVMGSDKKRAITMKDLNELKYTECVIREVLRLYPSVAIIAREIREDFKYTHSKLGDGIIPAGVEFLFSIYTMQRDAERFPKPNDFIPERHENLETSTGFSMTPFSAGPRNCIGQKFAMLEMKTMIAKTVREYELLPLGDDVHVEQTLVLRSSTGHHLGLKKRE